MPTVTLDQLFPGQVAPPVQPPPVDAAPPPPAPQEPPPAQAAPTSYPEGFTPVGGSAPPAAPPAAPPPAEGAYPAGFTAIGGGGAPVAAQPAPSAQPAAANQPPPTTADAQRAVGDFAGAIPGWVLDRPAWAVEAAQNTPGAVLEFTGATKDNRRIYRPGDPTVTGAGAALNQAGETAADQGLQQALGQGPGNVLNILGAVKDVGASKINSQMGEISPEGAGNRRAMMDAAATVLETGQWPEWATKTRQIADTGVPYWFSFKTDNENSPMMREILTADDPNFLRSYKEGYTDEDGTVYAPGADAMWAYYQSGHTGLQKAAADFATAPIGALADAAAMLLTGGGEKIALEAGEQAARLGVKQGTKASIGAGMKVVGRGIDAAATMGLSEAVPLTFKALGKGYHALPWLGKPTTTATQTAAAQAAQEAGMEVLSQRRMAEGQPGVPTAPEPPHVTNPTKDKTIFRVTLPADASGPAVDIAYKVDKKGVARGVYDVVIPGASDRYRMVTVSDAEQIADLWLRLPNAERQRVRQAWFPTLSRLETSPGEPFIEHAAERVFDRAGNLIADTGRIGEGYERELRDLRGSILSAGRPEHIVTDFSQKWLKTLTDGKRHPLTRRTLAEHSLQTLRDVLDGLPASYRTPEITRHLREMEDMLPLDAPGLLGTGLQWRGDFASGRFQAVTARQTAWLREMAAMPTKELGKKGLDGGRVGGSSGVHIIFDRKPAAGSPIAFDNGYATYLDLMDFRGKNPVTARTDLAAMVKELNGLRRAAPTAAAEAREDAIKEVLERVGAVPGASALSTDQTVIAIENYLRATKPTFPNLPGASAGPPAGIYAPGSQDELWGMALDDKLRDLLDVVIDISGTSRNAGQRLRTHWEETAVARELAKQQGRGVTLSPVDQRALEKQVNTIAERFPGEHKGLTATKLAAMTDEQIDRLAASLLRADMEVSQGVRNAAGRTLTPAERRGLWGKGLSAYDKVISLWRSTVLYNVARGVTYPMMQLAGNLQTIGIVLGSVAERGGSPSRLLAAYVNPREWKRSFDFLRNPDIAGVPRAVAIRERVGLGRTENLGRVSRDQLGSRTAYNGVDSHAITKGLGSVLGSQFVKDLADNSDIRLRHALWEAAFDPAYRRLKHDLAPMAQQGFDRLFAARGVPLPLTRAQIDAALADLDARSGGYFSQPDLRQALFDAAGGSKAANRQEVWNAADRIARDYKNELRKIDDAANAEVNRVAFAGGDTNLEAIMQRMFMFTWWMSRASQLYMTEAAKSPIQMALWARALEAGNQRTETGTNPRYRFMMEFMQTPAGYTTSLNPFSMLGTYLLGDSSDPADERSVLTSLGQITEGGWTGDNLILSPVVRALAFTLGALGQDARTPDMFGTNRLEREIIDGLNLANHHFNLYQTQGGNPERVPYPGFSQGVINRVAQVLSGRLPGTQQVAGYDPNATPEGAIASYAVPLVLAANPELDPNDPMDADTLRHGLDLAMADHDSPIYQQALGLWTESLYQGPLTDRNSAALDVLGAVTQRWVLPVATSTQPTERTERNLRRGRDELRDEGSQTLSSTAERSELDKRLGAASVRSPEGRDLALVRDLALGDPQTQAVKSVHDALVFADAGDLQAALTEAGISDFRVDRYAFTAAQIATLPEEDRRAIAERFLDGGGQRQVLDDYYATYNEQLRADKAFADAEGLSVYARQYPGGVDRFADDTAQINPNYKRFIEGDVIVEGQRVHLPDLRVTDHEAWAAQVTQYDQAATVIAGVKDGRYGLEVDPKYAGVVAGLDGETVGAWLLRQNAEEAQGKDSEFVAALRADYTTLTKLGQALDTLDRQWGQAVGTNRAVMAQRLIAGEKYPLDLNMKAAVEALGVSDTSLDNPQAAGEYLAWSVAQPAGVDTSIDAYQRQYWSAKNKAAIPQIAMRLATGQVPALTPEGTAAPADPLAGLTLANGAVGVGVRQGLSTIAAPTILAEQPGGAQGISVPAGMPIQTGQMKQGSDGSVWVYVTAGGSIAGWINASNLAPAA